MDPIVTKTTPSNTEPTSGFQIDVGETTSQTSHPGIWLILLGILWIFIGLTGKGTTEKCLRYKEVVKKIRV